MTDKLVEMWKFVTWVKLFIVVSLWGILSWPRNGKLWLRKGSFAQWKREYPTVTEEERCTDLSSGTSLKIKFLTVSLPQFCMCPKWAHEIKWENYKNIDSICNILTVWNSTCCDKEQILIMNTRGTWHKSGYFENQYFVSLRAAVLGNMLPLVAT
jgi:hypothetical protein